MKKEKVVILQIIDATQREMYNFIKALTRTKLPYKFIISSKEIKSMSMSEFKKLCQSVVKHADL